MDSIGVSAGQQRGAAARHAARHALPRALRKAARWAAGLGLSFAVALAAARPLAAEVTAEQVRAALERGSDYLRREQKQDGSWPDHPTAPGGVTALCTLALLTAGSPPDDPAVAKALTYLRKIRPDRTYALALQTLALCAAEPRRDLLLIRENAQKLERMQLQDGPTKGAWAYSERLGGGDPSNAQFALLALHEAERAGVSTSERTWRLAQDYWKRRQLDDGAWGYAHGMPGSGSMTSAGLAVLVMAAEKLGSGDATVQGGQIVCCGAQQDDDAVARGLAWLGRNFSVQTNPGERREQWLFYYLYALERVGRLNHLRFIGKHDWFREGAEFLVRRQDRLGGQWRGAGHAEDNPHIGTALALLFLGKGRRPILVAKLEHGPGNDWNHHRRDLAHLTAYTERRWGRELTWQIVNLRGATVDDLNEAPVLFLSGSAPPDFDDDDLKKLRAYIDRGGFLFAEACCDSVEFDRAFRQLIERVFPEPEFELRLLEPDHPVWGAEERVDPDHLRELWGVDIGCRTSVIYCPPGLGCLWELDRLGRKTVYPAQVEAAIQAANSTGLNVLAYATNRELKFKLEIPRTLAGGGAADALDRARLYVGKLRHGGGWNAAPGALANLLATIGSEAGVRVSTDRRELALDDPKLFDYPIVFLHGRNAFRLSDAERAQLRLYLERGGFVFGDAICASREFAASFRRELALVWPQGPLEPIPVSHPLLSQQYGGFNLRRVRRRDPAASGPGQPLTAAVREVEPALEGIRIGDRYAVVFSPFDLSCALEKHDSLECAGYLREDAARLGLNILLYGLQQ